MTYTIEEIEAHCKEMDSYSSRPQGSYASEMLRQLLAERKEIRRQAFEEAIKIVDDAYTFDESQCAMWSRTVDELRRKAGEEK